MSATASTTYRKLGRGSLAWTGWGQLWMGDSYLLDTTSILFLENYRRYFFHDAMAFVVQRTKRRMTWFWILGSIIFVCSLVGGGAGWIGWKNAGEDWHIALYVVASIAAFLGGVSLILLIVNVLRGPSCRCHVLTSTGWHRLVAPTRLGQALHVQAQIIPLIEVSQSQLPATHAGIE